MIPQLDTKWLTTFYEEGTWTPTYLGSSTAGTTTYSTQQGNYIRIGALVVATGTIVWTAATGTGNAQFSLPLTASATSGQNFSGSVRTVNITFANSTPQVLVTPSSNFFILQSPLTNAAATTVAMEAAGNIVFTVTYFVDA
jgi:hypothetical protein